MERTKIFILTRYLTLLFLGLSNLAIFYFIFQPLTIYSVFYLTKIFNPNAILYGNTIEITHYTIKIIPACIAGSAYYLLSILNLTTPMKLKKRIKSLFFLLISFYILNILRIIAFIKILNLDANLFNLTHKTVWYLGSTLLVVALWFVNVKLFKIKSIPVYNDTKKLLK